MTTEAAVTYLNPVAPTGETGIQYDCKSDKLWIAVETITWMMTAFQVYLIIVLMYFAWIVTSLRSTRLRTGEEKFGQIFSRLLLAAAVFALCRLILNLDTVWHYTNMQYTVLKVLKYIFTTLALGTLYSILWLRQKVLYTHRMTEHVSSKYIRILVWGVLILLALVCILNGTFFIYPDTYAESPHECLFHDNQSPYVFVKWIVLLLSMGFFQILLLGLFIYPLVIQRKGIEPSSRQQKANTKYTKLIKRVIYSTVICMATDLAATVLVLATKDHIDHDTTDFLFDLSLFVNQMSIFYSFGDWKAKLFPWLPSSREFRDQQRRGYSFRQSNCFRTPSKTSLKSPSRASFKNSVKTSDSSSPKGRHTHEMVQEKSETSQRLSSPE